MDYKNITHNLETLSEEQKSDLELAETLLENMNSLSVNPPGKTQLKYEDSYFISTNSGFLNQFVCDDINNAIKHNLEKHLDFIVETVQKAFTKYKNKEKLKSYFDTLFTYYGLKEYLNYPLYDNQDDFKNTLLRLKSSVDKELRKE